MNLFIDTNILIDILTGRNGSEPSRRLLAYAHLSYVKLSISAISFVNAVYICKKYGMNVTDVVKSLKTLSTFINVIDLSGKNVIENLSRNWKDYEDSTQDYCAQECDAIGIVTHNNKDFSKSSLPIYDPEESIKWIEENLITGTGLK